MQLRVLPPKMTVGSLNVGAIEQQPVEQTGKPSPFMGPLVLGIFAPYAVAAFVAPEEKIYRIPVLLATMAAGSWVYNAPESPSGLKTFGTALWWGSLASFGVIPFADQLQSQAEKHVRNIQNKVSSLINKKKTAKG